MSDDRFTAYQAAADQARTALDAGDLEEAVKQMRIAQVRLATALGDYTTPTPVTELRHGDLIVDEDGTTVEVLYDPRPIRSRPGLWSVPVGHPDIARHHWGTDVLEVLRK